MPVVFAQPSPISGSGAAQQWSHDMSGIAQLASIVAQNNRTQAELQGQFNTQDLRGRQESAQLAYRTQNAAAEEEMNRRNQGSEFESQLQSESIKQQNQAQLQAWVNSQDMTQKEQMRLKQLQSQVSDVNADPNLSPDEKSQMILQMKTGIDPLNEKLKNTKLKQEQEQLAQQVKWGQIAGAHNVAGQATEAQAIGGMLWTDPQTQTRFYRKRTGEIVPFYKPGVGHLNADGTPLGAGGDTMPGAAMSVKDDMSIYNQAHKEAMDIYGSQLKGTKGADGQVSKPTMSPQDFRDEVQKLYDMHKQRLTGGRQLPGQVSRDVSGSVGKLAAGDGGGAMSGPALSSVGGMIDAAHSQFPDLPGGIGNPLRIQAIKDQVKQLPDSVQKQVQMPFNLYAKNPDMTAPQKAQVDAWKSLSQMLPVAAQPAINQAVSLLAKYGAPSQMPPQVRQQYEQIKNSLNPANQQQPQPQQPAMPGPGGSPFDVGGWTGVS